MTFKSNLFTILLLISFLSSCSKNGEELGFAIKGKVTSAPDGSFIFIQSEGYIDSTEINKGNFKFIGQAKEPTRTAIYMKNIPGQQLFFWLENSSFVFEGKMDNIQGSKMIGGSNQDLNNSLIDSKKHVRRSIDSISKILRNGHLTDSMKMSSLAIYHDLLKKQDSIEERFVTQHPNSWVSISILNQKKYDWRPPTVEKLFCKMSFELQNSDYGKSINSYINRPLIGEEFVDFDLQNSEGELKEFSNLLGSYTLIEFWASWCLPCRRSNPKLVKLFKKYSPYGFEVVGVSIDEDKEKWLKAIKQDELLWTNLIDSEAYENKAYLLYGVNGIPDNVLINNDGIIIGRNLAPAALEECLGEIFE